MIYQFKVTLKDIGIPVWRRLQVDSEATFEEFHYILMAAFDWMGYSLYEFDIRKTRGKRLNGTRIGPKEGTPMTESNPLLLMLRQRLANPEDYDLPRYLIDKNEKLSDWFKQEKDRALFTYDFRDDWEHEIVLEKILNPDPNVQYPLCTKAKNDAPYEDGRRDLMTSQLDLTNPNGKEIV
ncbi:pRiA4b ORF-3-like protein [Alkalibacterium subtropicum]|uniref:PRiA4b ORF-3-like protein n=1 Tax=Alkalibacterium subtropicum TaxID=753702 RepID=A0A1I1GFI0_9LACT|nr:plasmid pRiA4b ORF-3 family protein [Alkalibacterium subtropicum]SFC10264.1 pRiA4b ORF-3-like protein [Alkalibacterium subtropicum]